MLVGVDIGTQSLKATVLSPDLNVVGHHAIAYGPTFPKPGWAEQDPALWEQALGRAINGALRSADVRPTDIVAVGLAGQLDGCIAVGANGRPLHPCLIWMDRRAEAEVAGIDSGLISKSCGVVLDASHPAAKVRWLKRNLRDAGVVRRFHVPVSYMVSRLTGEHVIDHATASTSMVYGLRSRAYEPDLLALFGIEHHELPEPAEAQRVAGALTRDGSELTGLPAGIPVSVGTGDDFASALGAGLIEPGRFLNVLGTAEVVGALHPEPLIDPGRLVETHAYPSGQYFIENPGWLSGGALAWFRETFRLEDFAELGALAATVSPGANGVTFIPALSGAMAPEWIAAARGSFYGLTPSHGTAHLARAVLEGTAFAMRDVLERLTSLGIEISALRLAGGGSKSAIWRQIRADLTGLPVEIARHADASPIGAAMLAGVAASVIPDLAEASKLLNLGLSIVEPSPVNKAAYDDAYDRYRRVFDSFRPLY